MDIVSYISFSFDRRYMMRWIGAGLILFIPGANFLSLGYLSRASSLSMIGGIGLPTWERKSELWWEGAKLCAIFVLYEALPCFLFSSGFLLSSLGNFVTDFIGSIMKVLAGIAFLVCSFFIPFAFCTFIEATDVKKAFEIEKIAGAVKEVLISYILAYGACAFCIYVGYEFHRIPFGFILSSVFIYYVMLVATYAFTQLFRRTSLPEGRLR